MKAFLLLLCMAGSTFAQGAKSSPATPPSEKIDAAALIKEILGRAPTNRAQVVGLLKIRGADANSFREVPIKWITRPLENEWHDVYTPEGPVIPPETLIVIHREGMTNRYEYRRNGVPVPEASSNPFVPFATSDFWLADFGLEFLHWPNPKHVKTEMRKGRPCYVIETRNPNPREGVYARVLSWIDTEKGGLIRAEGYTADGKLLKEFSIAHIKKTESGWKVSEVKILNDQADTSTRLVFELEIKE